MNSETIVLPTSRSIRAEIALSSEKTLFLPNYLTIAEFIERTCVVKGFKKPDNDTRVLLLLEAANFKKFDKLNIERNFFTFLQNSSYFFSFFTELAGEQVDIASLQIVDTYAEYEEHLSILRTLYENYELLCKRDKILDPIFLAKWYELNDEYVRSLKDISIVVEGYLTLFELELFIKCTRFANIALHVTATKFNHKMLQRFASLGFTLECGYRYVLNLNDRTIVSSYAMESHGNIECLGFQERVLQVAFIKQKVFEYVDAGIALQDIVVVLPNESFAPLLRLYDKERNFNFAMGESFQTTQAYRHLDAVCRYIEEKSEQNRARVLRYGADLYERLVQIYYKSMKEIDFVQLMQEYIASITDKSHAKILDEELYKFLKLQNIYEKYNLKATLHLFLERLGQRTLDDVGGGQITVMGLLETRYMHFKAVVLVDFNDNNVPKRSQKDLFLNSDIRAKANLPTQQDRENLQKHYYWLLLNRAKQVSIAYVQSQTPSRFLMQLGILATESLYQEQYALLLHNKHISSQEEAQEELAIAYDFTKEKISASSFKTFLECKRKYYNRYLLKIQEHEIPQDLPKEYEIGQDLHNVLKNIYLKQDSFQSREALESALYQELENLPVGSSFERYQLKLWKQKLGNFIENEYQRFQEGYRVMECETSLKSHYGQLTLVGQVDRIDRREAGIYILDYKSGKYPVYTPRTLENATDFQLEFYYLLCSDLGFAIEGCGYYDLAKGRVVDETLLREKLELLEGHLHTLQETKSFVFSKTEDTSRCKYCEYALMCGRA